MAGGWYGHAEASDDGGGDEGFERLDGLCTGHSGCCVLSSYYDYDCNIFDVPVVQHCLWGGDAELWVEMEMNCSPRTNP